MLSQIKLIKISNTLLLRKIDLKNFLYLINKLDNLEGLILNDMLI